MFNDCLILDFRKQNVHSFRANGRRLCQTLTRGTLEILRQGCSASISGTTRPAWHALQCWHAVLPAKELNGRRKASDAAEEFR